MSQELRPYQQDGNARVVQAARDGAKVIVLQAPTGAGKTSQACDLIRLAVCKGKRALVITHRRRLVTQLSERLDDFGVAHGIVMRGHSQERSAPVQVASRDTLLAQANDGVAPPSADLVIVDEGRHATSPEFRRLLLPYEGKHIVLLDATPAMPDGSGLGPWAQALVVTAKVTELVKQGYLVPVKCYAPDRKLLKGKVQKKGIAGDLVGSWQDHAEGLPTVLFCSRVQNSIDAVEAFNTAGIPAAHIDADTPDRVRDHAFDSLADGTLKVVSNVGIIKEGVDVPALGCCQLYMNVSGRTMFLQAAGRIMRPHPGKTHGVLIDHSGACFRLGFPDEDTEWSLDGNVDANWKVKHARGETEKPLYCKHCERLYTGQATCPECGRLPQKPPRSVFAPLEVLPRDELLIEAERNGGPLPGPGREEKINHWWLCLRVAVKRNGTFKMASLIFKQKYHEWPGEDFPHLPGWAGRQQKVALAVPSLARKKVLS